MANSGKAFFNWSGGKDSALALYHSLQNPDWAVELLLTSLNSETNRVSMHGVHKELLIQQARSIGLPLELLELPGEVSMDEYDRLMSQKMANITSKGIETAIFGDIFLEDLKQYRETQLSKAGFKAYFPLWKRDTRALISEFLELGFRTLIVSVDGSKLDKSFVGRELTLELLHELPSEVDPCGENGEFHTFVFDGPIFQIPIQFSKGEVVGKSYKLSQEGQETVTYWFQDLIAL